MVSTGVEIKASLAETETRQNENVVKSEARPSKSGFETETNLEYHTKLSHTGFCTDPELLNAEGELRTYFLAFRIKQWTYLHSRSSS